MADRLGRRFFLWLVYGILILSCFLHEWSAKAAVPQDPCDRHDSILVVPGFVVIKFKADAASPGGLPVVAAVSPSLARSGVLFVKPMFNRVPPSTPAASKVDRTDLSRIALATIPADLDPRRIASDLSLLPDVEYAEPRYSYPLLDVPNDSLLSWQAPYLSRMNVFAGWSIAKGDPSVVIATVDGGTDWQHEEIAPNIWINCGEDINDNSQFDRGPPPLGDEDGIDSDGNGYVDDVIGWNFTKQTNDPAGLTWQLKNPTHGTVTASVFGAATNNVRGIAGTSWNCRTMPVCVAGPTDGLVAYGPEGIAYAYQNGASVINLSWGGFGDPSRALEDVINAATESGALIVAAAGNSNSDNDRSPFYPAGYEHVLAVGATSSIDDAKAGFSNYGRAVPVFACGVDIWGAQPNGCYANAGGGTSHASPIVAGLAGLLRSAHPAWTPAQIAAQIAMTADNLDGVPANSDLKGKLGHGRVNFARALSENGHVGIEIVKSEFHSGFRTEFYLGDSLALSLRVKNILFTAATNVLFTVTCPDSSINVLNEVSSPITLQPGEEVELPEFACTIAAQTTNLAVRTALVRVDWVSSEDGRDSRLLTIMVNSARPTWMIQESVSSISFRGVKAVNRSIAWAVGGGSGSAVFRTTNTGVTWHDVTGGLYEGLLTCVDALDELRACVGTDNGRIFGTTDGGLTWKVASYPGYQAGSLCAIRFLDHVNGIALGNPGVNQTQFVLLRTADGGATWSHLPSEPAGTAGEVAGASSLCWFGTNHGWFGTNQSRVWRTTDGGQSWTWASTGLVVDPPAVAKACAVIFLDSLWGQAYHPHPYLARSSDGGSSWWSINDLSALGPQSRSAVAGPPGSTWVWAATDQSVMRSTNRGFAWSTETLYPIKGTISHLSASTTILGGNVFYTGWAVTDCGEVLKSEYSMKGIANSQAGFPSAYALFQNYPNPSNPSAAIPYYLPDRSYVILEVFNALGEHVATLQNGDQEAGFHEVQFDGRTLASGVYFYRMKAGDPVVSYGRRVVQTRKLLLLH